MEDHRRGPGTAARLCAATILFGWSGLVSGCSAIRFGPEQPGVDLSGEYAGEIEVDGRRIATRLDLRQDGDDLEAMLRASELSLAAEGEGDVDRDGTFSLELGYDLECPGTARLQGRWLEEGLELAGTMAAADCTGSFAGEFAFRRR